MRNRLLLGLTALTLVGVACAFAAPSRAAESSSAGACTTTAGVSVVVDFRELGGGVGVRCGSGQPRDGFDALRRASISYQTSVKFPGFMCRIANKPASDPCQDASPSNAYWTYWIAEAGGRWCPSNNGAGARTPVPGTYEGWSFSRGKPFVTPPPPRYQPEARAGESPKISSKDCTAARGLIAPTRTVPTSPTPTIALPGAAPGPGGGLGGGLGATASGSARRAGDGAIRAAAIDGVDDALVQPFDAKEPEDDALRLRTRNGGSGSSPLPTLLVGVGALSAAAVGLARRRARDRRADLSTSA